MIHPKRILLPAALLSLPPLLAAAHAGVRGDGGGAGGFPGIVVVLVVLTLLVTLAVSAAPLGEEPGARRTGYSVSGTHSTRLP